MPTRWYREQLPRVEFFRERGATRWIVLRSPWVDQATRMTVTIAGRIDGTQDTGYEVDFRGADGIQQPDADVSSSNLNSAGTQEVGMVLNEYAANTFTSQLNSVQIGGPKAVTLFDATATDGSQYRYPVVAIQITHLNDDEGGNVDIFDPLWVTGTVFYEVED